MILVFSAAAFVAVALLGPGAALQRLARVSVDPTLVLPLGLVAAAAAYWVSVVIGIPAIFPVIVALLDLALLWRPCGIGFAPGLWLAGALPPFLVLVAVLALTQFPWNRNSPRGEFLLDS